jgi:vitamin B12 transporter
MANGRIVWTPTPQSSLGLSISFTGKRFDDPDEMVPLAAFATVDVFGSVAITDRIQLYARGDNVLDAHYETAAGYHAPPRNWLAGLKFSL